MAGFYPVKHWMAGYNLMLWDVKKSKCGGERVSHLYWYYWRIL